LIDPPTRGTEAQVSERTIAGGDGVVIDVIGKPVTKIHGRARIQGYGAFTTFEGAVATMGNLVYSEEPTGIQVLFVSMNRQWVNTTTDTHLADVEFWIIPDGTITSGF
jgi:hypothetical protein